jgi:ketosteroid isomerase-like protein
VDIVRAIYTRWNKALDAGEAEMLDAILIHFDRDVELDATRRHLDPGVSRGHRAARRFFSELVEAWSIFHADVEELVPAGDRVLAVLRVQGRGRTSGVAVDERIAHIWTLRDGLVVRHEYFGDVQEARRAVADAVG